MRIFVIYIPRLYIVVNTLRNSQFESNQVYERAIVYQFRFILLVLHKIITKWPFQKYKFSNLEV
jgi:hypothetical protein